jgi:outer membrane protein assembly factor BamB
MGMNHELFVVQVPVDDAEGYRLASAPTPEEVIAVKIHTRKHWFLLAAICTAASAHAKPSVPSHICIDWALPLGPKAPAVFSTGSIQAMSITGQRLFVVGGRLPLSDKERRGLSPRGGIISAFDAKTGHRLWTTPFPGIPLAAPPVLSGGRVYTATFRSLMALRASDGRVLKTADSALDGGQSNPIVLDNDHIYVTAFPRKRVPDWEPALTAFSRSSLRQAWRYRLSSPPNLCYAALYPPRQTILVAQRDGPIIALDAHSGKVVASNRLPGRTLAVTLDGRRLFVLGPTDIRCLDPATLKTRWQRKLAPANRIGVVPGWSWSYAHALSARGRTLLVADMASLHLLALDATTGRLQWSYPIPKDVDPTLVFLLDHWVVFGRRLYASPNGPRERTVEFRWLDRRSRREGGSIRLPVYTTQLEQLAVGIGDELYVGSIGRLIALSVRGLQSSGK